MNVVIFKNKRIKTWAFSLIAIIGIIFFIHLIKEKKPSICNKDYELSYFDGEGLAVIEFRRNIKKEFLHDWTYEEVDDPINGLTRMAKWNGSINSTGRNDFYLIIRGTKLNGIECYMIDLNEPIDNKIPCNIRIGSADAFDVGLSEGVGGSAFFLVSDMTNILLGMNKYKKVAVRFATKSGNGTVSINCEDLGEIFSMVKL